ncbi:MAG: glycosyltransferase family 39 protein [Caldilineaceae bacterium]
MALWAWAKRLALPALCLGGFALRLHLLSAWPFREDEAMYSVWALHLWRVDPWALTLWPDKPPLFLWLLGGTFQLFGPSEAAARLLNIAADTLTIGVVAATARHLWNRWAGFFAATAYTLSPFAISFSPTAYTDPTLVLWGMLALLASLTRRPFWAGLFLAAAIATKQQGLLYAPLIVGMIFLTTKTQRHKEEVPKRMARGRRQMAGDATAHLLFAIRYSPFAIFCLGFALLTGPILLWDASRWAVAPSPWDLSVQNYAPLVILPPENWLPRLAHWGEVAWQLAGSWWVSGVWILGIGYWVLASRSQFAIRHSPFAIILLWSAGFAVLHIVTSVQIWDRYLLPLAPMLALFVGWMGQHLTAQPPNQFSGWYRKPVSTGWVGHHFSAFQRTSRNRCRFQPMLGMAALLLLLLPPALTAAHGGLPVGADHGDYAGLNESIAWLRANAPTDAIVYHRDVSWQLRFAFFGGTPDQPNASDFELRWFPNAVYLADNAAKSPARRKFLIEPTWATVDSAAQRLQQRSIGWQTRLRAANFTLYELTSPPALPCDWCLCTDRTTPTFPDWFVRPASQHPILPLGVLP